MGRLQEFMECVTLGIRWGIICLAAVMMIGWPVFKLCAIHTEVKAVAELQVVMAEGMVQIEKALITESQKDSD